jgi:UDP:flavonoid glycosyltransferase YjiC (YdhE family)
MRIALATVGTTGDARPFGALAATLVAAGHEVTAISWDLHAPTFADSGARFVAAGPSTTDAMVRATAVAAAAARTPLDQVAVLRDFHLRDAVRHHGELRTALRGHGAAVIHGIHALAIAAARDEGIRHATAAFDPVLLPTATAPPAGMPSLGPLNRGAWWLLDRMLARHDRALADVLRAAGSGSTGQRLFRDRSPLLHLVAVSPILAPPPRDLPPHVAFTGAWIPASAPRPLPAEVEAFLAAGEPPILVTFGSMSTRIDAERIARAAALAAGRRVIVHAPSATAAAEPDALSVTGEVDHRALLPRVAAVIHHGGAGTTHAVVAAGRSSVVVPHVGDQRYWAARLASLGVAPRPLDVKGLEPAALAERIGEAAAPAIVARAGELGVRVAAETGNATAARLIGERLG